MTEVAILWHMHQPYYEDLVTHEHILPWARLHTLKDYYGMAALLDEFPDVRLTFNLVPSLLVQIEAYAEDRAQDPYLSLGMKPAADLTQADATFIVRNFFDAQRARMIDIYPRYAELFALRGLTDRSADVRAAVRRFGVDDLRDLQVWQKLTWMDPFAMERDPRVVGLLAKGRGFTEEDKRVLRDAELDLLAATIPAYRAVAARGQAELSTSPMYHPILPLLCDTEIYKRTHPEARSPRRRFMHPEDAAEQLARAVACHERLFGHRPTGLWPSEGSVSDAMVPIVARAGFEWLATDELVLARTIGGSFTRNADGVLEQPERLYRPHEIATGGERVRALFRDHALSDLIGFAYAGWPAEQAAEHFVSRLVDSGRAFHNRTGGEVGVIPVILDGENAWEHFEGGGRPFLRALYRRLSSHPELRTVTMGEACRRPRVELTGIFPGSWIDANFSIWIGHQDDQRAWSQLAEAREALAAHADAPAATLAQAREEVLIAEGSDWFWWYGDDHSSDHDAEFDSLFRRHIQNVYRLLGLAVPDELFESNISTAAHAPAESQPTSLVTPVIDGEDTSYFEWLGAGVFEVRDTAGAMHQTDRAKPFITLVRFGFGRDGRLSLRFDTREPARVLLDTGHALVVTVLTGRGLRLTLKRERGTAGVLATVETRNGATDPWELEAPTTVTSAAQAVFEIAIPRAVLESGVAGTVGVSVVLRDPTGAEIERHPAERQIRIAVPDERFSARHWTA